MERAAVERYYDMFSGVVFRVAFMFVRRGEDAEDILQDVFLELFTRAAPFSGEGHVKAWLITVAANKSKNLLRRQKYAPPHMRESDPFYYSPGGSAAVDPFYYSQDGSVTGALNRLEPNQRAAVYLRYYEGYTTAEIAKLIGKSAGNVRVLLSRARDKLRVELKE